MNIEDKLKFLTIKNAVLTVLFLAGWGAGIYVAVDQHNILSQQSTRLSEQALQLERLSALIAIDHRYEAILESIISKTKEYGTIEKYNEQQIVALARLIYEKSILYERRGLTPAIILSLFETESGFDPTAVSYAGAMGLGQVMKGTAIPYLRDMGIEWYDGVLMDPILNADVSLQHWMFLHGLFVSSNREDQDDFNITSVAYNNGYTATKHWLAGSQDYFNVGYAQTIRDNTAAYAERGL